MFTFFNKPWIRGLARRRSTGSPAGRTPTQAIATRRERTEEDGSGKTPAPRFWRRDHLREAFPWLSVDRVFACSSALSAKPLRMAGLLGACLSPESNAAICASRGPSVPAPLCGLHLSVDGWRPLTGPQAPPSGGKVLEGRVCPFFPVV